MWVHKAETLCFPILLLMLSLIFYLASSRVRRGLRRWCSSVWVENEIYFLPAIRKKCRWMDIIAYCLWHFVQLFSKISCKVCDYAEQEMKYLNDNAFQEQSHRNINRDGRNYSYQFDHLFPLSDERSLEHCSFL